MRPRVIDLFAGACGGWSLGLHRAGFRTVAACEIDPWRRSAYLRNFPGVRMYDDVRILTADALRRDLGYLPEIVVGSPPCQDISAANHRGRGVDGERSGLFFEAVRIIGEARPAWACLENSPRLRGRGADRVIDALEALGYAVWPLVVGADDVGANHRRKRVWLLAADAERVDVWLQPGWGCGANGIGAAEPKAADTHPDGEGQHAGAGDAEAMGGLAGAGRAARGDAADAVPFGHQGTKPTRPTTPEPRRLAERDGAQPWAHWNGGPPRTYEVDARISAGLAYAPAQAAYGDSVVPVIPGIIGRAILSVSLALGASRAA